jgi:hypothetical protein
MTADSRLHAWLQAASEDELRYALGLSSYTTGKGKVDMKDTHMRPIEVFMCSVVSDRCIGTAFLPRTRDMPVLLMRCCCSTLRRVRQLKVPCADLRCLRRQVRRMGYGDGFRWVAQYIK